MTILDLAVGVRASIIRITTRAFSFIFINEKLYRWRVRNIPERRWINIIFSRTPRRVYTHYYTGQSSELLCISTRRCFVVIVVVVVYTLDEKSILEMIVMIIKKKEKKPPDDETSWREEYYYSNAFAGPRRRIFLPGKIAPVPRLKVSKCYSIGSDENRKFRTKSVARDVTSVTRVRLQRDDQASYRLPSENVV